MVTTAPLGRLFHRLDVPHTADNCRKSTKKRNLTASPFVGAAVVRGVGLGLGFGGPPVSGAGGGVAGLLSSSIGGDGESLLGAGVSA